MDWSNCFTFEGLIVSYSSFQMAWEVVEKAEDDDRMEICHRWFKSWESAERLCVDRISGN